MTPTQLNTISNRINTRDSQPSLRGVMRTFALFLLFLILASCESGLRYTGTPVLQWDPDPLIADSDVSYVRAINAGSDPLWVTGFQFDGNFGLTGLEFPFHIGPGEEFGFQIQRLDAQSGSLSFDTNGVAKPLEIIVPVTYCDLRPIFEGQVGGICDFGESDVIVSKECGFTNVGSGPCEIASGFVVSGNSAFSTGALSPTTVYPDETISAPIQYVPSSASDNGKWILTLADSREVFVLLSGNTPDVCLSVDPVYFGDVFQGIEYVLPYAVQECNEEEVSVSVTSPFDILDGNVVLSTEGLGTGFVEGSITAVTEFLSVSNVVTANVLANECPSIQIVCEGSTEVVAEPLDRVVCEAAVIDDGPDAEVVWAVEGPEDSTSSFEGNVLYLDLAGTYTVQASAFDIAGCEGVSNTVTIVAIPLNDIHIQLVWNTPSDSDQTDSIGTDMDLHFRQSRGCWDTRFNVSFRNVNPDWGIGGPVGNPILDIDDTDGAGPENINLDDPEDGITYTVGVHYWSDSGFGESDATVRIYRNGAVIFESSRTLRNREFWTVASFEWNPWSLRLVDLVYPAPLFLDFPDCP